MSDARANRGAAVAPAEWLALAAGIALVIRYAWHLDDAFVYFRYVDNFVLLGRGLVFNEGEFVEGYSSPAWTLFLSGVRWATPLTYWTVTRAVGVLAFAAFWWMLVELRRATVPAGAPRVNLPLLLLAPSYPVATYFTSGTESPLVLLEGALLALFALAPARRWVAVGVGLAPLVRPEFAVALAVLVVARRWRDGRWPRLALGTAAVTGLGWLAFRVRTYADLVPNTFHLKDEPHWAWGIAYLHDTLLPYGGYVLLALVPLVLVALARRGGERAGLDLAMRGSLWLAAALVALYVVRIGGDGRHFRYLALPWVLALSGTAGLAERCLARFAPKTSSASAFGLGASLLLAAGALYPRQLDRHPLLPGVVETRVGVVRDAQFHRAWPGLAGPLLGADGETEVFGPGELAELWRGAAPLAGGASTLRVEAARSEAIDPPTLYAVSGWCHECWRGFTTLWVHEDGLTEPLLAHSDAVPFRPAHFDTTLDAATEIARIRARYGAAGAFRRAVEAGDAAPWVARNLDAIEVLERRMHNRHDPLENLGVALRRVPRIVLDPPPGEPEEE